jgi:hypothetical protein
MSVEIIFVSIINIDLKKTQNRDANEYKRASHFREISNHGFRHRNVLILVRNYFLFNLQDIIYFCILLKFRLIRYKCATKTKNVRLCLLFKTFVYKFFFHTKLLSVK